MKKIKNKSSRQKYPKAKKPAKLSKADQIEPPLTSFSTGVGMAKYEVSIEMLASGVKTFNTFQASDVPGGGGPFASIAERVRLAWEAHIMTRLSSDIALQNVKSIEYPTGAETNSASAQPGTTGGDMLPINCGVQFTKVAVNGRNGRMFIAGYPEGAVTPSGLLTEAARIDTEAAFKAFLATLLLNEIQMTLENYGPSSFGRNVNDALLPSYIVRQSRRLNRAKGA